MQAASASAGASSSASLAALADEIGAQDASYVGKLFKHRFGVSAGAFRKAAEEQDVAA